jgi:hypothetical protein
MVNHTHPADTELARLTSPATATLHLASVISVLSKTAVDHSASAVALVLSSITLSNSHAPWTPWLAAIGFAFTGVLRHWLDYRSAGL